MSRSIGRRLTPALAQTLGRFGGVRDQAIVLATTDADGAPRFALLSLAEIVVVDDGHLLVALWPTSSSGANLERTDAASLLIVEGGTVCTVVLRRDDTIPFELDDGSPLRAFACSIGEVREDRVGYASIVGVLEFELADPGAVLPRWQDLNNHLAAIAGARTAPARDEE